jgi:hypothetical protein
MKILQKIITILLALVVFAGTTFYEMGLQGEKMIIAHVKPVVVTNDKGASLVRAGTSSAVQSQMDMEVGDAVKTSENQTAIIAFAWERMSIRMVMYFRCSRDVYGLMQINQLRL